jgi:hypothetical protein
MRIEFQVSWEQLPRWKKTVISSLWVFAMVAMLWWAHLWFDYGARMPRAPQPETSRVHPFQIQCVTHYATAAELSRYQSAQALSFGSWFITFLMVAVFQRAPKRRAGAAHSL